VQKGRGRVACMLSSCMSLPIMGLGCLPLLTYMSDCLHILPPLQELGITHIEQEHNIGHASVDILVVVNGVKVALEVDGPSHYSSNKLNG
jgi:hypothetical protein